jgi:hypothetical protein
MKDQEMVVKLAWRKYHAAKPGRPADEVELYRKGLIDLKTLRILESPTSMFGNTWWGRGRGRYAKRQLSKTRRQIWKQGSLRVSNWESYCNWKGS